MERALPEVASPRRRRTREFVTQNACNECRRRRAKCDGQKPCGSCTSRNIIECMYEVPIRVSKENMRKEIEQLQGRLYVRETVIDALAMDESPDPVLQQLRNKVPLEEIADQVYKSFPSLKARPPPSREKTMSSETDYGSYEAHASEHWKPHPPDLGSAMQPWKNAGYIPHSQESIEKRDQSEQTMHGIDTQWTEVSSDEAVIEHMFALYFCWEYPIFQTLSKEHFLSDLRTGTHRYCSHLLVNAMLALGCRLSAQQGSQSNLDERTMASPFFAEAKRLLAENSRPLLPAVQALGLMSLYEASCGRDSESWFFSCQSMQMAIEMGLHIEMPIYGHLTAMEQEVRTVTFWGAFSLHQAWSLTLGRLPYVSRAIARVAKCPLVESIESSPWTPYRDEGIEQGHGLEERSNVRTIHRCLCELSEIIHDSLYVLYTPGENLSSTSLLEVYAHYLAWKGSLPESCHLGANSMPAVLHLHMYYHFALIMLFRPFIKLRFLASAVSPLEMCLQAANNISLVVQTYKQAYSFRQTPVFFPYVLLASTTAHLATVQSVPTPFGGTSPTLPELADLQLLSARLPFAKRAISIIKFLARQWGVDLYLTEPMDQTDGWDDLCLPIPGSMNFFCPNLEVLASSIQKRIDITLFRPFPMQGMPLLPDSFAGMERTGFHLIR